jgi:hypothetical protein
VRFDRILTAILEWINTLAWWNEGVTPRENKPYERIQSWRLQGRGMLHRVKRPPEVCPRAVATYLFEPFRYETPREKLFDLHLCCDHLEGMHGIDARSVTHRITLLKASHWPGADGLYDAEKLFQGDYDLQGRSPYRDKYVICILHRVAQRMGDPGPVDWAWEIEQAGKQCLSYQWSSRLRQPGQGEAIAYPVDPGTKPVKIRY